jgi:hypothetical protein
LHGGGAAVLPGAGMGALGVRVLRLQMLKQRALHSVVTRTSQVGYKKSRFFSIGIGKIALRLLQTLELKSSHVGRQIGTQSSSTSAITSGPMDSTTSTMQAATGATILCTEPLAEAIDQYE